MKSSVVMVRMPDALKEQLDREAKQTGELRSVLIRRKLSAIPLADKPHIAIYEGRKRGIPIMVIEIPMLYKKVGKKKAKAQKRKEPVT